MKKVADYITKRTPVDVIVASCSTTPPEYGEIAKSALGENNCSSISTSSYFHA